MKFWNYYNPVFQQWILTNRRLAETDIEHVVVINRLLMVFNYPLREDQYPVDRILSELLALINIVNTIRCFNFIDLILNIKRNIN
jgi:hypothetical protein